MKTVNDRNTENKKIRYVYVFEETKNETKPELKKIGVAVINRNGSISIILDRISETGRLFIKT